MHVYTLAPSDLSYLYDRCPRCYWLKLHGVRGDHEVLPGAFREIDKGMKTGITLAHIQALGIPAVEIIQREKVVSQPAEYGGALLQISGYTDKRVRLDDGSIAVLDYKTSAPRLENVSRFWRAMSSYQYAIEHATDNPEQVLMLALIVFSPSDFWVAKQDVTQVAFRGRLTRMDIDIDRPKFDNFLEGVGKMLATPTMPAPGACETCRHAQAVADKIMAEASAARQSAQ